MEAIYDPKNFRASEPINLNKYFSKFKELIVPNYAWKRELTSMTERSHKEKKFAENRILRHVMGTEASNEVLSGLAKACSLDKLTCNGESSTFPLSITDKKTIRYLRSKFDERFPLPEKDVQLEILKTKEVCQSQKPFAERLMSFRNNHHFLVEDETEAELEVQDLDVGSDFVMEVLVYRPFAFNYRNIEKNGSERFRFSHSIKMLGQNTLAQLRDTIYCVSDSGVRAEVQSTDVDLTKLDPREKYPSAYIFIEDTFYNDMRSPNAIDLSEVVRIWAKDKSIGDFKMKHMELTKLETLTVKMGYPYVYTHFGDCEHILVFSDAHLLKEDDCLNLSKYPYVSSINRNTSTMCYLCNLTVAKWLCLDSDRLPQQKTFLCTDCCNSYNFIGGKKVGQFKLYPLFHCYMENLSIETFFN